MLRQNDNNKEKIQYKKAVRQRERAIRIKKLKEEKINKKKKQLVHKCVIRALN